MSLHLDACCGQKRWAARASTRRVFVDLLSAVAPDIVADVTCLPFRDSLFDVIWCDPPHHIRGGKLCHFNKTYLKYGRWKTRAEWESFLDGINIEFARVAAPRCVLVMKIIDGPDRRVTKLEDLKRLTKWRRFKIRLRPSRVTWSNCETVYAWYRLRS